MRRRHRAIAAALGAALGLAPVARAQSDRRAPWHPPDRAGAPSDSFEVGAGAGVAEALGRASPRPLDRAQDWGDPGAALALSLGVRALPALGARAWGEAAAYVPSQHFGAGWAVRSDAIGVAVDLHGRPFSTVDPVLSLGTGYREHRIEPPERAAVVRRGLELLRVELGVDVRASSGAAFGPRLVVAADRFEVERLPSRDLAHVASPRLVAFVGFGVVARFDLLARWRAPR